MAKDQDPVRQRVEHLHNRAQAQRLNGGNVSERNLALEIVIAKHCRQCRESVRVADALKLEFPALDVQVIDLDAPDSVKPDVVFAVPSFLLNGRVVSLGNPDVAELSGTIRTMLLARGTQS